MKKCNYILSGIAVLAIMVAVTINVKLNLQKEHISGIALINVEALSSCESPVTTAKGLRASLECVNSLGEIADVPACDFDANYTSSCTGRSWK
jgi:hypothetical protein